MGLHYRAVWRDDRPDLVEQAFDTFGRWLISKKIDIDVPSEGQSSSDSCDVAVRRAADKEASILQASLTEHRRSRGMAERWTTIATSISQGDEGWIWIDVERESEDIFGIPPLIAAPNLAGELLGQRTDNNAETHLGPKPLRVTSSDVDAVIDVLFDSERTVPIVLFSADPSISPKQYAQRARRTAKDLAGCADVRMLTADSEDAFNAALPDVSLKVYRGGVRIYLPTMTEANPKPYRHRYILSHRLTEQSPIAARRIAQLVLPMMLAQSPPVIYRTRLKPLIDRRDWEEIAIELDQELNGPHGLRQQIETLKTEKAIAYDEAADSESEIDRLSRRNELLRNRLRELSESPEAVELAAEEHMSPDTCRDAVTLATELSYIKIHPDAPVDLDRLDESENSVLWARRIWRHLKSLNAYAEAKGSGFANWCETSGSDLVIGSQFIAMSESQSVMNNSELRRHRLLPIDPSVDQSGYLEMEAHLKPVQGGGMQIPRIYFHDDTKGRTGKIHIGFIGPHDRMPNQSRN